MPTTPTLASDYQSLAEISVVEQALASMRERNFKPIHVPTRAAALVQVRELIPDGVSVMNGSSKTLEQIGFVEVLKNHDHKWNNLHDGILAETEPGKQALLRRQSVLSDYYVGSAHAVAATGEIVVVSNSGSQLPHIVFTSPNIILVVGSQKITLTLSDALRRIEEHVVPLEDERMKTAHGMGTTHAKTVILHRENPMMGRNVYAIIVDEVLGF